MRAAMIPLLFSLGLIAAGCGAPPPAQEAPRAAPPPLVGLDVLFAPETVRQASISPDGRRLAWVDGRGAAWLAALSAAAPNPLGPPVAIGAGPSPVGAALVFDSVAWAESGALVLLGSDAGRLYGATAAEPAPQATALLRPDETLGARWLGLSPAQPDRVVVMIRRAAARAQLISIDLTTGARAVIERNANGFADFYLDGLNRPRVARQSRGAQGDRLWRYDESAAAWHPLIDLTPDDALASRVAAIAPDGASALLLDSVGRERAMLVAMDLASGAREVLGQSPQADVGDVWIDPATRSAQAFAAEYLAPVVTPLSPTARDALAAIDAALDGDIVLMSRSRDDGLWIIAEGSPTMGGTVHLFDRRSRTVRKLMAVRPALAGVALAPMRAVEIAARDGQTLVAYLTVPAGMDQNGDGRPDAPLPLVLAIRDPAVPRDHAAFRVDHQWLANRGYAVLSVNFRGSIGFGKAFQALGAGAFGAGLQADLEDALNWVVQAGVAAPGRLATLGEGLAGAVALTLAAGLQRPVACTAALGPVIDPLALPERERTPSAWARFVGAGRSPADIARITGAGIAARINAVAGRVFLVAGPPQESAVANLAAALQAAQKAVVLVEPGDAVRPLLDRFFAACLGGRSQGLPTGADASIRLGAEVLAGAP